MRSVSFTPRPLTSERCKKRTSSLVGEKLHHLKVGAVHGPLNDLIDVIVVIWPRSSSRVIGVRDTGEGWVRKGWMGEEEMMSRGRRKWTVWAEGGRERVQDYLGRLLLGHTRLGIQPRVLPCADGRMF